uniref:Inositol-pentakisphosphate 2-kinase n=1 Tax=Ursus americanus TaxID=9643 RepID=A0A452RF76_URSAM
MKEFLGETYVHCGEVVQLPLDFVKQLCLKIQSERPESRCDKDLDTLSGYALCLPNLARLQTYHFAEHRPILCVEIKPKCGFIPLSSDVTHEVKRRVCRYCMHQHLKVATGKWKQISKYCPLDLYSGNKQRMHFALKSLLQEAQNNLKIFKVRVASLSWHFCGGASGCLHWAGRTPGTLVLADEGAWAGAALAQSPLVLFPSLVPQAWHPVTPRVWDVSSWTTGRPWLPGCMHTARFWFWDRMASTPSDCVPGALLCVSERAATPAPLFAVDGGNV